MGSYQRYQKSKSFQCASKSIAGSFLALLIFACSNKAVVPPQLQEALNDPQAPSLDVTYLGIQLTKTGQNDSPYLSVDGKQVVYISRNRTQHQQRQVYLFDIDTLQEKRVTYQDGETRDPILFRDGKVAYASTTDELKERPILINGPQNSPYPPTDIYSSDISGSQIQRLTHRNGFDGLLWPRHDQPNFLMYSIWNGKFLEVHQLNLKTKKSSRLLSKKDRSIESLRLSPNGKQWAWIERQAGENGLVVIAAKNFAAKSEKILPLPAGDYKEVIWMSNDRIIVTAKSLKKFYQFYLYDLMSSCLQSLFESNSDLSSPRLHEGRDGIVFTSTSNNESQIYYKSLTTSEQCLKWEGKSLPVQNPAAQ